MYGGICLFLGLAVSLQVIQPTFQLKKKLEIDYDTAVQLATLPFHCIKEEYPNKLSQLLRNESDLLPPSQLHPIFYGCYDWHSSVHGHWLLAKVGNLYADSDLRQNVSGLFDAQFLTGRVETERDYFQDKTFERTYGWAWLLKLQEELLKSEQEDFTSWVAILGPLVERIVELYKEFLPKLVYPVRVGEHPNTAFGLAFGLDYARLVEDLHLEQLIVQNATGFFSGDKNCPLNYEPSGTDFLSPCLAEADLMTRILTEDSAYESWLRAFLPQLFDEGFILQPGQVVDRTDGKLVHLDGLNFSRGWALYTIATRMRDEKMKKRLVQLGDNHLETSMEYVVGSHYVGSHWLASFLLYALDRRQIVLQNSGPNSSKRV